MVQHAIRDRQYASSSDYRRIRHLLLESYRLTGRHHNWDVVRLDSYRYGRYWQCEQKDNRPWMADVRLWETEDGQVVGVAHPEEDGDWFLDVHPHHQYLWTKMLDWVEQRHQEKRPSGPLNTFVHEDLDALSQLLAGRGYTNHGPAGVMRSRALDAPIPARSLPPGYTLRALTQTADDLQQQATITNIVFNSSFPPDTFRVRLQQPTPFEDWVVVAPDGRFASFCTIWVDENKIGCFEPVGTHPNHRRRGLAQAMMCAGLQRLRELGAKRATLGTGYHMDANRLYVAVGFHDVEVYSHWQKEFS